MRKTALYIAALLLAMSCNKAIMESQDMGFIRLSLSSEKEVVVATKAETVACDNFLVDIYGETFLGQTYNTERYIYSEMPEYVMIPFGYYYVAAQSCTETAAEEGRGTVRYYGVSPLIDILSKDTTPVSVECRMANGKVTLTLDESFMSDFTDTSVELTVGTRTVDLSGEEANGLTDVYFNVPENGAELLYKVYGTVGAGTEQEKRLSFTNAASPMVLSPAKWAKITIRSNHNGVVGPDISVDGSMDGENFTEVIKPDSGDEVLEGYVGSVSIVADTKISDATVIDCVIDVL